MYQHKIERYKFGGKKGKDKKLEIGTRSEARKRKRNVKGISSGA